MATKDKAVQNGVAWAGELGAKYASGIAHMFILHFNVQDYAAGVATVGDYLTAMLSGRDLIITYDIASGIQFRGSNRAAQKEMFIKALGLDQQGNMGDLLQAMNLPGMPAQAPVQAGEVELPCSPAEALPLLEQALHLQHYTRDDGERINLRVAVIIEWAEQLAPASSLNPADRVAMVTLARWATDPAIIANQGIVILITRNLLDLPDALRASTSRIEAIAVGLPDEAARLAWIEQYLEGKRADREAEIEVIAEDAMPQGVALDSPEGQKLLRKARKETAKVVPELRMELEPEVLARMTSILSLIHIEDIFLRAMHENRAVDAQLVKDRRDAIVAKEFGDILEMLEAVHGLDMVVGHEAAKAYFRDCVIEAIRQGKLARVPMGVLLMGPAGTGKTALIEAIAKECGFNAVVLNLAKILEGIVGSSERNLERALMAIEALAPVIVFTDEIDQKMPQRGSYQGDSGVSARLFGRVMEFMSDTRHRGRIVWLAATNRPDLLDAAFKRPGRFDAKIPLLLPSSRDERLDLFYVMLRKYGLQLADDSSKSVSAKMMKAADMVLGYTGAEIEGIVVKANQLSGRQGRPEGIVHPDDILEACELVVKSTRDVELMTALALAEVTDLEFVPEVYRTRARDKEALASEVEALAPTTSTARRTAREL